MDQRDYCALIGNGAIWTKSSSSLLLAVGSTTKLCRSSNRSGELMVKKVSGVRISALNRQEWPGLVRTILDMRWETEPGWIAFSFDAPMLCVVLSETGGRCQTRTQPQQPPQGDYFGTGHLSFVAASGSLTIYAAEMRDARIAFYQLDPGKTDCLSPDQAAIIARADSRYMFRDERLYECARLLGEHDVTNGLDVYGLSLARALQLTLLSVLLRRFKPRTSVKLTGERLAEVLAYVNDHLDQSTAVKDLARIAKLSHAQFGRYFRDATGMSLQRWQMDARIRSAQRLMVDDPAESLTGIASLVGFSDSSHFSRAFLEVVGTTPSAWLRQRT
jgi:AraC family transcriptional regulator